ncbi:hypothetical protein P7M60_26975, partial [Vibrio parahaemolyticus]|nr:hypothetical protein [Vibrio parahaemolyticus]NMR83388.1 hypothetical protein [Vibrio parahaemolyticus]
VTEEDYRNSPWRDQVMDSFDLFSQFELERADKFSWMQDLHGDLQLSDDKSLWHYWPFVPQTQGGFKFTLAMLQEVYPRVKNSKIEFLRGVVNELNAHVEFYKLDTPLRRAHFFAQIMQETGSNLSTEELFRYSFRGLVLTFRNFARDKVSAKELSYDESVPGKNTKRDGSTLTKADFIRVANIAYGGRMGNDKVNDGWKFRGRGLKQLT